jgi:hypothetical protein
MITALQLLSVLKKIRKKSIRTCRYAKSASTILVNAKVPIIRKMII